MQLAIGRPWKKKKKKKEEEENKEKKKEEEKEEEEKEEEEENNNHSVTTATYKKNGDLNQNLCGWPPFGLRIKHKIFSTKQKHSKMFSVHFISTDLKTLICTKAVTKIVTEHDVNCELQHCTH